MDNIERLISAQRLAISGVGAFSFNTLYKLVSLKENHPQLLERAHAWLFISSLINHRLTGEFTTNITMARTAQMLDIQQRDFSPQILQATGIPRRLFPRLVEAGEQIGTLQNSAAAMLGLPVSSLWVDIPQVTIPSSPFLALVPTKMNPCSLPVHGKF